MVLLKQTMAAVGWFVLLWLLAGCTEVIVPGAFTGAGEAYRYSTSNVVKKTLMGDVDQTKTATRKALKKMKVHFHSMKTEDNEIDVIIYYLDGKNGPTTWQTRGWFRVDPGQKKHVVDTHNRYIYLHGKAASVKKKVWTGDLSQWFEGKRYKFFKVDMGTSLNDFTYAFSCK
jgi:uncharacterized membrane protein